MDAAARDVDPATVGGPERRATPRARHDAVVALCSIEPPADGTDGDELVARAERARARRGRIPHGDRNRDGARRRAVIWSHGQIITTGRQRAHIGRAVEMTTNDGQVDGHDDLPFGFLENADADRRGTGSRGRRSARYREVRQASRPDCAESCRPQAAVVERWRILHTVGRRTRRLSAPPVESARSTVSYDSAARRAAALSA